MRSSRIPRFFIRSFLALAQILVVLILGAGLWLGGCSANDPFDPNTLANIAPVVRMSMAPVDSNQGLNPTSYFNRQFHWSGTDQDGWVTEFHISIRTDSEVPAPWDTTLSTDTTMTFATDVNGDAEATFLLACRDNRGALSDTLVQFIPLRNFPPALNFQSDFDPLRNLQRELRDINGDITEDPGAAVDTTYWNWGAMNFRMFALDLDGLETMNDYYLYTFKDLAEGDPDTTFLWDDPNADATVGWVRTPFPGTADEVVDFEIFVNDAPAGLETTLTVSVLDEADSDTRFQYSWEVREPSGPVLYIPDNSGPLTKAFYRDFLATEYGPGNWDEYSFWFGYPDHSYVLLESMRKFQGVLWADGGSTSPRLTDATQTGGVLQQYVFPEEEEEPGGLILVSKGVVGPDSGIPHPFLLNVLGVDPGSSPNPELEMVAGKQALGQQAFLPAMTSTNSFGRARGLKPPNNEELPPAETIYQMEWCRRCYSTPEPWDPIVGMRFPHRDVLPIARTVTISLQLEYFNHAEVMAGLSAILTEELGVTGK